MSESIDVRASNRQITTNTLLDNLILKTKVQLSSLPDSRVLIGKAGNESRRLTVRVEFGVQCSLREDGHLPGLEGVVHVSGPIFRRDRPEQSAFNDQIELCGAGVRVRSVEAAWAEKADCDGCAVGDERGEAGAVGADGVASLSEGLAVRAGVFEVEDEVGVGEKTLTLVGAGCSH